MNRTEIRMKLWCDALMQALINRSANPRDLANNVVEAFDLAFPDEEPKAEPCDPNRKLREFRDWYVAIINSNPISSVRNKIDQLLEKP